MNLTDLSHLLSREAKRRRPSKIKDIVKFKQDGISFLAGGLPLPAYFAWDTLSATTINPPFYNGITEQGSKSDQVLDVSVGEDTEYPISTALQYGLSPGPVPLVEFIKEHTKLVHKIPYEDWDVITTAGTTQSWCSCLRTFCDEGDFILVEHFTFSSSLETAKNLGVNLIPMDMDSFGIDPVSLEAKLNARVEEQKPLPKLIYTIPTGQNPTGISMSSERRKEIYHIAQKFNLLIIEDEPYYFLQLDEYSRDSPQMNDSEITTEKFLRSLLPSFLSIDVDGRVIRLDSFSKTLAPGSRVGWMTGQTSLLERFVREFETSIQTPSGFSTAIIYQTLRTWGQKGYLEWLKALRKEYTYKRNVTIDACYSFLPLELVKINVPIAGMFFTISIDTSKHPRFQSEFHSKPKELESRIMDVACQKKVVLVPGSWFEVLDPEDHAPEISDIFFRGTYAATDVDVIVKGMKRFGEAISEVFS